MRFFTNVNLGRAVWQLSGLRVPFCMLLFCLVSTSLSAPCPLKDHVALASLPLINGMSVPSCVVAPGEGMVHLRRGLRPLHMGLGLKF